MIRLFEGRAMRSNNDIGDRGEAIFEFRIMEPIGPSRESRFRPCFLGEKWPTIDYLVELVGLSGRSAFFFAQVKTTSKAVTASSKSLSIKVRKKDTDRMVGLPAPTYLIGIDENNETAYIIAVNEALKSDLSSLPVSFPLDATNLERLWDEVDSFWKSRDMILKSSVFSL